jgi:alkylhydroperoxidase family enzyme
MFILNHVKPEDASGKVAEAYAAFPPGMPVPEPLVMMSASPYLANIQGNVIRYFRSQEGLDLGLLATIRYLVASEYDYQFCINFNAGLLQQAGGMSAADLANLRANPEKAPLEESQKEMLLFVLKAVKSPEKVTRADVEKLHQLGWTDQNIFDAVYHGSFMVALSIMFKAFVK